MSAYRYIKSQPKLPCLPKKLKKRHKILPALLLGMGLIFLANAGWPILNYQLKSWEDFNSRLLSPIGGSGIQILGKETVADYYRPNVWFPTAPELPSRPSRITHYTLSVPRLKINEAVVEIGGSDLIKNLIHYQGTALPGQPGNTVIFGHSTLVQFYNPKNYKTIFSTLPTLEEGDEILINFDGIVYRFLVFQMVEVKPTDYSVLDQEYDDRYLSLITCVPPGTYLRRLVVKAKLI